jgi:cellulose synthase/poly-beta-1,6-N-acetylglucosamine synthase-like glycosyltransferase
MLFALPWHGAVWTWVLRAWVLQAWVVALAWLWRGIGAAIGFPTLPDLLQPEYDDAAATGPQLTVVVPALNEEENVRECLESLIAQDRCGHGRTGGAVS